MKCTKCEHRLALNLNIMISGFLASSVKTRSNNGVSFANYVSVDHNLLVHKMVGFG